MDHKKVAKLNEEFRQLGTQWDSAGSQLRAACARGESDYRIKQHFREMESIYKRMYLCLDRLDSEYDSEGVQYSTGPFKDLLEQNRNWLQTVAQQTGIESQI